MKYYIIAGEASGDLHGSNLIKAIKEKDSEANIRCWGGDLMQAAGGILLKHYKDMALISFHDLISNMNQIFMYIALCLLHILEFNPDIIVFIDYSGFNLTFASYYNEHQFRIPQYIATLIRSFREWKINNIIRH